MSSQASARTRRLPVEQPTTARRWLVIEPLPRTDLALVAAQDLVVHCRFENLLPARIGALTPDTVLTPLIAPQWDILDLGLLLTRGGFRGTVLALTPPLPRSDLVLGEVRALFPALALSLVVF